MEDKEILFWIEDEDCLYALNLKMNAISFRKL